MSEYTVIVTNLNNMPDIEHSTKEEISPGLTSALGGALTEITKVMGQIDGGGWEIISHNLVKVGHHWAVSFLLRR